MNSGSPHVPGRALVEQRARSRSAGSPHPVRLARLAAQPRSPAGFPSRRPGPILHPILSLAGEDRRVEDPPQDNSQRMLPRALTTSRNPP